MVTLEETVNGYNITLTRGDTLQLLLTLTKDGETYTPDEEDEIRFALKAKYTDSSVLINKTIPNDTLLLELEPDDTKPLTMGKTYVYDIQLTDVSGRVDTFISGKFTAGNEVD